jgi:hypothetical protein
MSQIVKQTIRVRSGKGRRTDAPTVPLAESPLTRMGLLMPRSVSAGAFASVAEYGNMDASKSLDMRSFSCLTIRARDGAPLFRVGEIFHCHSGGCLQSLVRDTVKIPVPMQCVFPNREEFHRHLDMAPRIVPNQFTARDRSIPDAHPDAGPAANDIFAPIL